MLWFVNTNKIIYNFKYFFTEKGTKLLFITLGAIAIYYTSVTKYDDISGKLNPDFFQSLYYISYDKSLKLELFDVENIFIISAI